MKFFKKELNKNKNIIIKISENIDKEIKEISENNKSLKNMLEKRDKMLNDILNWLGINKEDQTSTTAVEIELDLEGDTNE